MHNVDLEQLRETIKKSETDPAALEINAVLEGEWRTGDDLPQFGGTVKFGAGETLFESDFPVSLGGKGRRPTPLQYCFWGGIACFASTFAIVAADEGIEIKKLTVQMTGKIDFHQATGLAGPDPITGLTWNVKVDSPASDADLERLLALAEERCPASWMLGNVVPLKTSIQRTSL
ncbi:MAG TPA: OsmC family protein [Candidatus Eisenbacteria bacterium]|nr:OsmC family protein [Candidatus Eisenbacteria bacterium]